MLPLLYTILNVLFHIYILYTRLLYMINKTTYLLIVLYHSTLTAAFQ